MSIDIDTIYVGGQWVAPSTTERIAIQSPATGERVGSIIPAGESDVDHAVTAARAAFDDPHGWSNWEPAARGAVLNEFGRQYRLAAQDVARTVSQQNGMPISQAALLEGAVPAMLLSYYAGLIEQLPVSEARESPIGARTLVSHAPVGVVAAITPWNVPQTQSAFKYARHSRPVAPWYSNRPPELRWTPCCWPRSPRKPGCQPACSTCYPAAPTSAAHWWRARASTRCRSPARPRPDAR